MSEHETTRHPAFTETIQIGFVVRDLDATIRRYEDDYGIGPWSTFDITPENAPDLMHDGEPIRGATRGATAMVGGVMWEVIQPLDEHGIFARHLAERGEGVHHIALATSRFDDLVEMHASRGSTFPLSGSFGDMKFAYLPTERDLGVLIEIFAGTSGS